MVNKVVIVENNQQLENNGTSFHRCYIQWQYRHVYILITIIIIIILIIIGQLPAHFVVLIAKPYYLPCHFLLLRNKKSQLPAFLQDLLHLHCITTSQIRCYQTHFTTQ